MNFFKSQAKSLILFALLSLNIAGVNAANLKGQNYLDEYQPAPDAFTAVNADYKLFVKFNPSIIVDLSKNNSITFSTKDNPDFSDEILDTVIQKYQLSFTRVLDLSSEELSDYKSSKRSENSHNRKFNLLPFAGLMEVHVKEDKVNNETLLTIANTLEKSANVEYAELQRVEEVLMEVPPSFSASFSGSVDSQGYQRAHNPSSLTSTGVDVDYAWALGLSGEGVLLHDIEYDWEALQHEEFLNQDISYGTLRIPSRYASHGVSVIGILMADPNNDIGIKGAVPNARMRVWPERAGRVTQLLRAAEESPAGSIIILEQQTGGIGGHYVPADFSQSLWDAIQTVTNSGIHVIAAAGNGNVNLDKSSYTAYRNRGDNGSIRVGAGYPNDRSKLSFSTYGSPIHIQGWGNQVHTTTTFSRYTSSFNGTSSATPVATQALALIQECLNKEGRSISPRDMRQLLIDTGIPQGAGGHIGPLPNIKAALESLSCTGKPSFTQEVIVEAEDYIRASDNSSLNEGNEYRLSDFNQGVDIEASEFNGFNIGYTEADEWLEYYVGLEAGTYQVNTRVSTLLIDSAYALSIDELNWQWNDTLIADGTGGWQNWKTHDAGQLVIPVSGVYTIRVDVKAGGTNLNWFKFTQQVIAADVDQDGVADDIDNCANTPSGSPVDTNGCEINNDADNDGIVDNLDQCENTPNNVIVGNTGCEVIAVGDSDNDGVIDTIDQCDNTPLGSIVNISGCVATFVSRISNVFDRSFDTSLGNSGNASVNFDSQDVDLERSLDKNTIDTGWSNISYIEAGEWLEYDNITIIEPGSYILKARIASLTGDGGLSITLAGSTVTNNNLPSTGDWQVWQTIELGIIHIDSAGQYTLLIDMNAAGFNLNYVELEPIKNCNDNLCQDTDLDGINDDIDRCVNTTQGVQVDSNGCEISLSSDNGNCSDAPIYPNWTTPDWEGGPNTHHEANDTMVYQGQLYSANWYTSSLPGSDETWTYVGACFN